MAAMTSHKPRLENVSPLVVERGTFRVPSALKIKYNETARLHLRSSSYCNKYHRSIFLNSLINLLNFSIVSRMGEKKVRELKVN
jgi:hypothetical protein